jgi:hypothetical protein
MTLMKQKSFRLSDFPNPTVCEFTTGPWKRDWFLVKRASDNIVRVFAVNFVLFFPGVCALLTIPD